MATKVQAKSAELYEADFYVWAEEQAALLRARRFDALDLDNLIEEVEGLADTKLSAVLNGARVVMEHLLKLQFSPATDPRNTWRASVREHRRRVQTDLTPRIERISATSCRKLTPWPATTRRPACATTGRTRPPTPCPPPARTLSTRSRATGGPEALTVVLC